MNSLIIPSTLFLTTYNDLKTSNIATTEKSTEKNSDSYTPSTLSTSSSSFLANSNDFKTSNATTEKLDVILYMARSKYEEWLKLDEVIPELQKKQHFQRKALRKRQGTELKNNDRMRDALYLKIHHEKVNYESIFWNQQHLKNSLLYTRYLAILQNHIEHYERFALHFEPDMYQVKRDNFTTMSQLEEICRQKWNYLLLHYSGFVDIRDLINNLEGAGMEISEFSELIARGYKILSRYLRPEKLHEIVPMRFLPDLSNNITGDVQVDKCFTILMNDYHQKRSTPKPDLRE